jgi:hypothetical protein
MMRQVRHLPATLSCCGCMIMTELQPLLQDRHVQCTWCHTKCGTSTTRFTAAADLESNYAKDKRFTTHTV